MTTDAVQLNEPVRFVDAPAAPVGHSWQSVLDVAERALILVFYGYLLWRLLPHDGGTFPLGNALLLISEGAVVFLILIRRPAASISLRRRDWLFAVAATTLPFAVGPTSGAGLGLSQFALLLMICGLFLQIYSKLSLGRSLGMVAANRGIRCAGPYRLIRHPMYAGYLLTNVGFLLLYPSAWNLAVYAICWGLQLARVLAEERFLSQVEEYREYMSAVRYRLVPGVF